jgi:hypothetical protein
MASTPTKVVPKTEPATAPAESTTDEAYQLAQSMVDAWYALKPFEPEGWIEIDSILADFENLFDEVDKDWKKSAQKPGFTPFATTSGFVRGSIRTRSGKVVLGVAPGLPLLVARFARILRNTPSYIKSWKLQGEIIALRLQQVYRRIKWGFPLVKVAKGVTLGTGALGLAVTAAVGSMAMYAGFKVAKGAAETAVDAGQALAKTAITIGKIALIGGALYLGYKMFIAKKG